MTRNELILKLISAGNPNSEVRIISIDNNSAESPVVFSSDIQTVHPFDFENPFIGIEANELSIKIEHDSKIASEFTAISERGYYG